MNATEQLRSDAKRKIAGLAPRCLARVACKITRPSRPAEIADINIDILGCRIIKSGRILEAMSPWLRNALVEIYQMRLRRVRFSLQKNDLTLRY